MRRFGPASQAWEGDGDAPQMWGTRRIGPDLAREGGRKSRDWQLAHLWNPRHVVPDSVMPGYPWLFDGSPTRPDPEALDLVNYLESLGRNARLAGLSGPGPLPGGDSEEERRKGMFCDCSIPRTAGKAPIWDMELAVGEAGPIRPERGRGLRPQLRRLPRARGPRRRAGGSCPDPGPRNLTAARLSDRRLSESLWNGVRGSSMPAWNDLPAGDLRGLVAFLRTIAPSEPAPEFDQADRATAPGPVRQGVCRLPRGVRGGQRPVGVDPGAEPDELPRGPAHDGGYADRPWPTVSAARRCPAGEASSRPDEQKLLARYVRSFDRSGIEE